jgi:hypothetical protein
MVVLVVPANEGQDIEAIGRVGQADRQDTAGIEGGAGVRTAGAQARRQLRPAHARGRQSVGYLHDVGGDRQETGGQLLHLCAGAGLR